MAINIGLVQLFECCTELVVREPSKGKKTFVKTCLTHTCLENRRLTEFDGDKYHVGSGSLKLSRVYEALRHWPS